MDSDPLPSGFAGPILGRSARFGSPDGLPLQHNPLFFQRDCGRKAPAVSSEAVAAAFAATTSRGDSGLAQFTVLLPAAYGSASPWGTQYRYRAAVPCGRTDRVCFMSKLVGDAWGRMPFT